MKTFYHSIVAFVLVFFLPVLLYADDSYNINFHVTDFQGQPIEDAVITINDQTNLPGDYHFVVSLQPDDTLNYEVIREGYMSRGGRLMDVTDDHNLKMQLWHKDMIYADAENVYRMPQNPLALDSDGNKHMVLTHWIDEGSMPDITTYLETHYINKADNNPWTEPERIHPDGFQTRWPSIAVTPDDRVFVAFQRGLNEHSKAYEHHPTTYKVDYDSLPYPYTNGWESELYVSERTASGWELEKIPSPTNVVNWEPQLISDSDGNLHMVWVSTIPLEDVEDPEGADLHKFLTIAYATNVSGEWEVQLLEDVELSDFGLGAGPQVAVSDNGVVHILYRGYHTEFSIPSHPMPRVYYATNMVHGGDFWEIEMLETGRVNDNYGLIKLEGEDVHVAIGATDHWDLPNHTYYITKKSFQWSEPVQVNQISYGNPLALFLDENSSPVISYVYVGWGSQSHGHMSFLCRQEGTSFSEEKILELNAYLNNFTQSIGSYSFLFDNDGLLLMPINYFEFYPTSGDSFRKIAILSPTSSQADEETHSNDNSLEDSLVLFPNPVNDKATLVLPSGFAGEVEVNIYDMLGHLVYSKPAFNYGSGENRIHFDVSGFSSGVYLVSVESKDLRQSLKLFVK